MWMDATANIQALQNREGVKRIISNCKKANINCIVLDVKPIVAEMMYPSYLAPKLSAWKGKPYPKDYDLLKTVLEEAHAAGIPVYASLNVFAEGHRMFKEGPGYQKPDWQAVVYDTDRSLMTKSGQSFPVNPSLNQEPSSKSISVWNQSRKMKENEFGVILHNNVVTSIIIAPSAKETLIHVDPGDLLLTGVGDSYKFLAQYLKLGETVQWTAKPTLTPIAQTNESGWAVFVNPANPFVKAHELALIREVMELYPVDGVVLDRMRYGNLHMDFSNLSRAKFERWLGKPVENWPEDIYAYDPIPGKDIKPGKYYKDWLEWRAFNIQQFLLDVAAARKVINPKMKVAIYAGSWYDSYYNEGVNWASRNYQAGYDWMTPHYSTTGFAEDLDFLCTGAYSPHPTKEDAISARSYPRYSVQGETEFACQAIDDATWVYGGIYLQDYKGNPNGFERAIRAACDASEGVMLFDLCYVEEYQWWPLLERVFNEPVKAPHQVEGLRENIHQQAKDSVSGGNSK